MSAPPEVGIVMGSDSDLPVMAEAGAALERFGIVYEAVIASAHRHTEKVMRYARGASGAGLKVIIAGAGGAAHLAGVIAALTVLPVIGVPVATEHLGGIDSLLSIVQMPRGVPVGTVAVNGAYNAGLLAVQILALEERVLQDKLLRFRQEMAAQVEEKDNRLRREGFKF
ncbi:MAG: 5-(carboxyamino)imidazole ribonucleotide mutase [Firmicutes bacterium]|nr:5-(carboxyamino)imidazole ribonucleotide mutase [Bacillota bacterium]